MACTALTKACMCVSMQKILKPLSDQIEDLAQLSPKATDPKDQPPTRRMVILQVLLCKLVDLLDAAKPWDAGPLFDADEEPRIFQRNMRCALPTLHLPVQFDGPACLARLLSGSGSTQAHMSTACMTAAGTYAY